MQTPAAAGGGAAPASQDSSLLGPVQVEFVEGLDIIVLRGSDKDVARVMQIINQIEQLSAVTVPAIVVQPLTHVGSEALANLLSRVYQQVLGPRTGDVSITPLGKPNALLLIGREENVQMAVDLAKRLDQPVEPTARFEVFPLRHAVAEDAKELIDQFLEAEESDDELTAALPVKAVVVADYRSNSLIVTAAPRELEEIRALVKKIDVAQAAAVDELRIFPLRNALAEDMAEVLKTAISQTGEDTAGDGVTNPRSAALRFVTIDRETRQRLESGIVTGVRIAPDERANALVVSAPADSMDLIAALIEQLDRTPNADADLKVFTIANGDAVALEEMLRTLFNTEEDDPSVGGLGAASNSLVRLTFSVDQRTNSIIAAGNAEDLAVVYAILTRLDGADTRQRVSRVFRLNNAYAVTVAETVNAWLESQREAEDAAELAISPFEQIDREVIVVAEEASNSLIISATEKYYDQLVALVRQLDERPPMVMVQVLIAEVRLNDTDEFGMELGLQDSLLFDRSLVGDLTTVTTTTQDQSPGGSILTTTEQTILNSPLTPGFNFNNVNEPLGNNGSTAALGNAANVAAQSLVNFGVGRVNNALGFGGFVLSASSNSVDMLLRALQENRRLEVLSRPQITMLDGQSGRISVGQSVPRIENVNITDFGQQNSITYEDVGIILEVTPRISPEGQVVMQIGAVKSEVGAESEGIPIFAGEGGAVVRAPVIDQTVAETTVMAASGQTVVLSGLLTKSTFDIHRRVPILADIPLLGDFFRFDSVSEERTELLIIMTPRVIRSEQDAEMIKQVESSRMSWVMCDVVTIHGPSGLRSRSDEWGAGDCESCYPGYVPTDSQLPTPAIQPQPLPAGEETLPWTPDLLPSPPAAAATRGGVRASRVEPAAFYQPPRAAVTPAQLGPAAPIHRLPPVGR
ncbi:MAG: secretin N-terminal domain-containing protein [Planctomycetota bacterium]